MEYIKTIIIGLFEFIKSDELLINGRLHDNDFIRNYKLNFEKLILLLLSNHKLTNTMELRKYFKNLGLDSICKSTLTESRKKLGPNTFNLLNNYLLSKIYENKEEIETFKDYLLLGVDGSKIDFPNLKIFKNIFYGIVDKFKKVINVKSAMVGVCDLKNKFMIDIEYDKYGTSEKELSMRLIKRILSLDYLKDFKKIWIFDRGFPSIEYFHFLMENNQKFLFRVKKGDYKAEKEGKIGNDFNIFINITKNRLSHIKDLILKNELLSLKTIEVRYVIVDLPTGEKEFLITNLDKNEFNTNDLNELYKLRWGIEVSFDTIKNLIHIEHFSGHSQLTADQDILADLVVYNISNLFKINSQKVLDEKFHQKNIFEDNYKQINTNILIGILKEDLTEIFFKDNINEQLEYIDKIIIESSKYYTIKSTIKAVRSKNKSLTKKSRTNNRRCC
jgi:hypothetical protein